MSNWPQKPFILAHRGARSVAPENTLEAFHLAFKLGADGIECDVFLSKEGVPVVIHDCTLKRTTSGHGYVWNHTAQELQQLGVPTLREVLDILPAGAIINIELKNSRPYRPEYLADQIGHLIKKVGLNSEQVIISSFDPQLLRVWVGKKYVIGLLFERWKPVRIPRSWKPDAIHVDSSRRSSVPEGFKTVLWTAPNLKIARELLGKGVQGVIAEF